MNALPESLLRFLADHPRIAVYGTGGMARSLLAGLAGECPGVEVPFLVDSFKSNGESVPPVVRVTDLESRAADVDGVVMATAFNREILAEHGDVLRRFPLAFLNVGGCLRPYADPDAGNGSRNLDERAVLAWAGLWHGYEQEAEAKDLLLRLVGHTIVTYDGLLTLTELVRHVDQAQVTGALVECGSWQGGASALMAGTHMMGGTPHRPLHIFDSFQGIPEPDGKQDMLPEIMLPEGVDNDYSGELRPIGCLEATLASNEHAVFDIAGYPRELVTFHEGWFQDTIPGAEVGPIAILRLDGDLYDSYKVCLEHLYPLVSPGGVVIIDDWCLPGCRQAVNEYFKGGRRPLLHRIDSISRYMVKNG